MINVSTADMIFPIVSLSRLFTFSLQDLQPLTEQRNHFPKGPNIPSKGPHRLHHVKRRPQHHHKPPRSQKAWLRRRGASRPPGPYHKEVSNPYGIACEVAGSRRPLSAIVLLA